MASFVALYAFAVFMVFNLLLFISAHAALEIADSFAETFCEFGYSASAEKQNQDENYQ